MKALISPNEKAEKISSWDTETIDSQDHYYPVYTEITNGCRIVQTSDTEFDVASPLYWVDCSADLDASSNYFDTSDNTIKAINHVEAPA